MADDLIDRVLDARPDLADDLRRALATDVDDAAVRLEALRTSDGAAHRALTLAVLAAYYRADDARAGLGYPGQEPAVLERFEYPEYISEGLLDHMITN